MSKRSNPFFDEDFLKEVNQKIKMHAEDYAIKPKVDHTVEALSCTYLHFGTSMLPVSSPADIDAPPVTMRPEFLHQFIEDETIRGYEDPQLHFYFARTSLDCYFNYTFKSKSPEAVNLESYFTEIFDEFLTLNRKQFEQKLEEQQNFEIPAKVFDSFVRGDKEYQAYLVEDITKPDFARFNYKMQIFLKFFIETSSFIEAEDNMWKVAFLVEKVYCTYQAEHRTFVGYLSYYPFYRRLDQYRVRISQQLILPVFQRRGLGSYLLSVPAADSENIPEAPSGLELLRVHCRRTVGRFPVDARQP
jgi:Histone acetyl transferase HAT1 N-terminus